MTALDDGVLFDQLSLRIECVPLRWEIVVQEDLRSVSGQMDVQGQTHVGHAHILYQRQRTLEQLLRVALV
ncbi:hypothetical protein D3C85_1883370 [compost metagenome]